MPVHSRKAGEKGILILMLNLFTTCVILKMVKKWVNVEYLSTDKSIYLNRHYAFTHTKFCPVMISHKFTSVSNFILQGHNISSLNCMDNCLKNSLGMRITEKPYTKQSTTPNSNKIKGWGTSLKIGSALVKFKDGPLRTVPNTHGVSIIIFNDTLSISSRLNTPKTCFVYYIHWLHKLLSWLKPFISNLNANNNSSGTWPIL